MRHMRTQHPEHTQDAECALCLDEPGVGTAATTFCNHRFCRACIEDSVY